MVRLVCGYRLCGCELFVRRVPLSRVLLTGQVEDKVYESSTLSTDIHIDR